MSNVAINIAAEFVGKPAFDKANKSVASLEKSVKRFASGLGIGLGISAVAAFGKAAAKAFAADELAATRLNMAVKNLGLEFANPYVTDYIANLEKTSKIADDMLRPAFQRLLQQTGSLAKSQSILNTAIEVSRGTGIELGSVSEDLAKAYYGQTRSLKKYSLGLTEAELKAKSFSEIQSILDKKFSGSSKAYLETYAGQIGIVSLAWNNLQENAGKALFTLAGASGDQSSGAQRLGGIMDAFGVGLVEAAKLLNNAATAFGQAYFGVGSKKPEAIPAPTPGKELFRKSVANDAKLKAIEERQAKLYKQQLAATKKLTEEQRKQAILKKAGTIFDLEQIQLIAALKGKLSDEDRKRVELQLALTTGNVAEAQKLTYELAKAQGLNEKLAKDLSSLVFTNNPFAAWAKYLDELALKAATIAMNPSQGSWNGWNNNPSFPDVPPATNVAPLTTGDIKRLAAPMSSGSSTIGDYLNVVLQIDGKTIASALQDTSMSGTASSVNRLTGGWKPV